MSDNIAAASEKGNMGFIVLICLVATLGGFLFGFDSGVINGTVKGLDAAFGATNFASGLNVASMLLVRSQQDGSLTALVAAICSWSRLFSS
jgi:hypothetical protein